MGACTSQDEDERRDADSRVAPGGEPPRLPREYRASLSGLSDGEQQRRSVYANAYHVGWARGPPDPQWADAPDDPPEMLSFKAAVRDAYQRGFDDADAPPQHEPRGLDAAGEGDVVSAEGSRDSDGDAMRERRGSKRTEGSGGGGETAGAAQAKDGDVVERRVSDAAAQPPPVLPAKQPPRMNSIKAAPSQTKPVVDKAHAEKPPTEKGSDSGVRAEGSSAEASDEAVPAAASSYSALGGDGEAEQDSHIPGLASPSAGPESEGTTADRYAASASPEGPPGVGSHDGAETHISKVALSPGVSIYVTQQALQPAGTRYGLLNESIYDAQVELDFTGSSNIHCSLPDLAVKKDVTKSLVHPPFGYTVTSSVAPPGTFHVMVDVVPANLYSEYSIHVKSKWQVLEQHHAAPAPPEVPTRNASVPHNTHAVRSSHHVPLHQSEPVFAQPVRAAPMSSTAPSSAAVHKSAPTPAPASAPALLASVPPESSAPATSVSSRLASHVDTELYAPLQAPVSDLSTQNGRAQPVLPHVAAPPPTSPQSNADAVPVAQLSSVPLSQASHTQREQFVPQSATSLSRPSRELHALQSRHKQTRDPTLLDTACAHGLPFVDTEFPPSTQLAHVACREVQRWQRVERTTQKRVSKSLKAPAEAFDIVQFPEAFRWVVMGLCVLLDTNPDLVAALFPAAVSRGLSQDDKETERVGAYRSWWCMGGWWHLCTTDTYLPYPLLLSTKPETCLPDLALKAYAKSCGRGFAGLAEGGTVGHFLQEATGCPYKRVPLRFAQEECLGLQRGAEGFGLTPAPDGDLAMIWRDLKHHVNAGRVVCLTTQDGYDTQGAWRGDCDVDLFDNRAARLGRRDGGDTQLPPDTSVAVVGYKDDLTALQMSKIKIRSRFDVGSVRTGGECWIDYAEALDLFASMTVCYATPGWEDVRVRLSSDEEQACGSAFVEVDVKTTTELHLWLGSADAECSVLGMLIFEPTGEPYSGAGYRPYATVGIERSAHVWGEVMLQPAERPYLIIPVLQPREPMLSRSDASTRYTPPSEYVLGLRMSPIATCEIRTRRCTAELVAQAELACVLADGEKQMLAEDAFTKKRVFLKTLEHYRWLGCAVRNPTSHPVFVEVDLAHTRGYDLVRVGRGVTLVGARLAVTVPAGSDRFVFSMVAPGATWEYSLQAVCSWLESDEDAAPSLPQIAPYKHPLTVQEVQINGETARTDHVRVPPSRS